MIGAVGTCGFGQGGGGGGGILLGLLGGGARFTGLCALGCDILAKAYEIALGLAQRFDAGTAGGLVVTFSSGSGSGGGLSDLLLGTSFEAFELGDTAGQLIGGGAEANRFLFRAVVIGDCRFVSFADGFGFGSLGLLGVGYCARLVLFSTREAIGVGLGFFSLLTCLSLGFLGLLTCLGLGFLGLSTCLSLGFLGLLTCLGSTGAGFLAFLASDPVLFGLHLFTGGGEVLTFLPLLCFSRSGLFGSGAVGGFVRAIGGFGCSQGAGGAGGTLLGTLGGGGDFANLLALGREFLGNGQEVAFGLAQRFDAGTAGGLVVAFSSSSGFGGGVCDLLPGTAFEGFERGDTAGQLISVGAEANSLRLLAVVIGERRFVSFTGAFGFGSLRLLGIGSTLAGTDYFAVRALGTGEPLLGSTVGAAGSCQVGAEGTYTVRQVGLLGFGAGEFFLRVRTENAGESSGSFLFGSRGIGFTAGSGDCGLGSGLGSLCFLKLTFQFLHACIGCFRCRSCGAGFFGDGPFSIRRGAGWVSGKGQHQPECQQ